MDDLPYLPGTFHIKVELYIDDILVRHSDDNLVYDYSSMELPIPLTFVDYDKEITGKQLKVKVEYAYDSMSNYNYVNSDTVQTNKYTNRNRDITNFYQPLTGLAKNIDVTAYFSDPRIQYKINIIDSRVNSNTPQRYEFTDYNQIGYLASNYYYYMPNGYTTSYLTLGSFDNNSMIRFNTDPNSDFTYDITINDAWYINKPFNFKRGKSYIIAAENNTIYWSEVQVK